ncbi:MAG: lytic transglycosylase domain-containing protein [Bryobacterales bacterium]|nr:lytic transglycosylase domain-containing protein [Bryobacterales bacterium]
MALFLLALIGARAADTAEVQRSSVRLMRASLETQRTAVARMRTNAMNRLRTALYRGPSGVPAQWPLPVVPGCRPLPEREIAGLAERAGARVGIAPGLLRAVIDVESAGLPCAVSRKGALGLMQLMPATALDLQVERPFDPGENVAAGARYLKQLLARYGGDLTLALGAYNAGPSRVDGIGGVPGIPETTDYIGRVLSRLGSAETVE